MRLSHLIAAAVAVVLGLTAVAAAEPGPSKQRVSIATKGVNDGTFVGTFVLTTYDVGALKADTGKQACKVGPERVAMRDGQQVSIYEPTVCTWTGKRGTFVTRDRNEWVDAGNGYHVNTGTWKLVRGTGQYAEVTGGGRLAGVWLDRGPGPWSGNSQGFLART
jgi:hypothetical protein